MDVCPSWYSTFNDCKIVVMKDPRITKNLEELQSLIASIDKGGICLVFSFLDPKSRGKSPRGARAKSFKFLNLFIYREVPQVVPPPLGQNFGIGWLKGWDN